MDCVHNFVDSENQICYIKKTARNDGKDPRIERKSPKGKNFEKNIKK